MSLGSLFSRAYSEARSGKMWRDLCSSGEIRLNGRKIARGKERGRSEGIDLSARRHSGSRIGIGDRPETLDRRSREKTPLFSILTDLDGFKTRFFAVCLSEFYHIDQGCGINIFRYTNDEISCAVHFTRVAESGSRPSPYRSHFNLERERTEPHL